MSLPVELRECPDCGQLFPEDGEGNIIQHCYVDHSFERTGMQILIWLDPDAEGWRADA